MLAKKEILKKLKEYSAYSESDIISEGVIINEYSKLEEDSEEQRTKLEEWKSIIEMRKRWSTWILGAIILVLVFDIVFILLLGFDLISYKNGIVPVFATEGLIKVVGLAYIVVNFLFNKDSIST